MKILLLPVALMLLLSACRAQEPVAPAVDAAAGASVTTDTAASVSSLSLVNWAQRSTPAGVPFNVQVDGNSGVSFELSQPAPPAEVVITMDGKPLTGVVVNGIIITATIPTEYLAMPGSYPVVVEFQPGGTRLDAGNFEVVQP